MTISTLTIFALLLTGTAGFTLGGRSSLHRHLRRPRLVKGTVAGFATVLVPLDAYCAIAQGGSPAGIEGLTTTAGFGSIVALLTIGLLVNRSLIRPDADPVARRVLAIGAHPDDLELGCAGTMAKLTDAGHEGYAVVVTCGERGGNSGERPREAFAGARFLGLAEVDVLDFADTRLAEHEVELVDAIEAAVERIDPDVILTHSANDQHQDHLAVHRATLRAARERSTILCYESPSVTAAFSPSVFFDIEDYLEVKTAAVATHRDQRAKTYMTAERVRGLAVYRGGQAKARHAEGFEPVRLLASSGAEL